MGKTLVQEALCQCGVSDDDISSGCQPCVLFSPCIASRLKWSTHCSFQAKFGDKAFLWRRAPYSLVLPVLYALCTYINVFLHCRSLVWMV